MKKTTVMFSAVLLAGLVAIAVPQVPGKTKMGSDYDPATVETLKGNIEEVKLMSFGRSRMGGGVHLLVNTGKETVEVHLGPRFFLEENGFEAEGGDKIEVVGSRITFGGQSALVAREIQMGDYTLALRDETGTPGWAGPGGSMRGRSGRLDTNRSTSRWSHCRGCSGCGRCGHHHRCSCGPCRGGDQ
jgi:hypothetical protein